MAKTRRLTIINNDTLRGVIAPADFLTTQMLENLIDVIELSLPESERESVKRIAETDRDESWTTLDDLRNDIAKQ